MKISLFCLLSGIAFLSSCSYNNEKELYPDQLANCDTSNVTFNNRIIFVLANNCFSCHDHLVADLWGDGIHLESYANVKSRITKISDAIHHTGGIFPMPKNASMLNACALKQFEVWIRNGTPEN